MIQFNELHYFYNLINVKIYFTRNRVNIILEFPIPLIDQLKFVKPIPVPNSNGTIIIPEYEYMLFENTGRQFGTNQNCHQIEDCYFCYLQQVNEVKCNIWNVTNDCHVLLLVFKTFELFLGKLEDDSILTFTNTMIKIYHCHDKPKLLILMQSTLMHVEDGYYIAYKDHIFINNITKIRQSIGIDYSKKTKKFKNLKLISN